MYKGSKHAISWWRSPFSTSGIFLLIASFFSARNLLKSFSSEQQQQPSSVSFQNNNSTTITPRRRPTRHVVFYNIYVGGSLEEEASAVPFDHVAAIVNEQLQQIYQAIPTRRRQQQQPQHGTSSSSSGLQMLHLKYNIIGSSQGAAVDKIKTLVNQSKLCRNNHNEKDLSWSSSSSSGALDCELMEHYESGYEDLTLQRLYEYCTTTDNDDDERWRDRVTYIHNKGSFHEGRGQDSWRYHGTLAALHDKCGLLSLLGHDSNDDDNSLCNVCALLFTPFPALHAPGNFWTTTCSFVKRLIPPKEFAQAMELFMENTVFPMAKKGEILMNFYSKQPSRLGLDRFAMEHWIGSHPYVRPCLLSLEANIQYWKGQRRNEAEFSLSLLSNRFNFSSPFRGGMHAARHQKLLEKTSVRYREYFLLPGLLLKWSSLYSTIPPMSSWIWSFYPDGSTWREVLMQNESIAVQDAKAFLPVLLKTAKSLSDAL